jgi:hypothetical protein
MVGGAGFDFAAALFKTRREALSSFDSSGCDWHPAKWQQCAHGSHRVMK